MEQLRALGYVPSGLAARHPVEAATVDRHEAGPEACWDASARVAQIEKDDRERERNASK
jgi:hypothetical protein